MTIKVQASDGSLLRGAQFTISEDGKTYGPMTWSQAWVWLVDEGYRPARVDDILRNAKKHPKQFHTVRS